MSDQPVLQKSPAGLLQVLELKTLGQAPFRFDDALKPVIDCAAYYSADRYSTDDDVGTAGAFPRSQVVTLVNFEQLMVIAGAIQIGAAAGTRLDIEIGIRYQGNYVPHAFGRFTPYIGGLFWITYSFPYPQVIPPGATVECFARGDAAGADHGISIRRTLISLSP